MTLQSEQLAVLLNKLQTNKLLDIKVQTHFMKKSVGLLATE
jgi:hypothetical protein